MEATRLKSSWQTKGKTFLIALGKNQSPVPSIIEKLKHINFYIIGLLLAAALLHMMPQMGNDRNFNYRIPPSWSPENDQSYSFRAFMTDISLWIMLTDLQPHQQCAAIIMRLGGSAREMARMITPQEMMNGGMLNGAMVDPVTYLLGALHARFSALEEESRLTAMTEMLAFSRRHGETINSLLARYQVVRQRAAVEGQFVMSVEGCALQLPSSLWYSSTAPIHTTSAIQWPASTNRCTIRATKCPTQTFWTHLRKCPRQCCCCLAWPTSPSKTRVTYLNQPDTRAYQDAAMRTAEAGGAGTYFGQAQDNPQHLTGIPYFHNHLGTSLPLTHLLDGSSQANNNSTSHHNNNTQGKATRLIPGPHLDKVQRWPFQLMANTRKAMEQPTQTPHQMMAMKTLRHQTPQT